MRSRSRLAGLVAGLVVLAGCSDSTGPEAGTAPVSLSIQMAAGPAAAPMATDITLGDNTITVDEVQLVLRKIALHPEVEEDACTEEDDSACQVLWLGPVLVDLAVDGSTEHLFTVDAPAGSYRRMLFQLHKPTGSNDATFLADNPGMAGVSVRVVGTFDGGPFEYTADLTVVQHAALEPPIVVTEGVPVDLLLEVDVAGWFIDQAGTGLINPGELGVGGQLDARIRQNIRQSFRAAYQE